MLLAAAGCEPFDAASTLSRAQESFAAAHYRTALIEVQNVLQADESNVAARVLLGRIMLAFGELTQAQGQLERARDSGASAIAVAPPLAQVLIAMNRSSDAMVLLDGVRPEDRTSDYSVRSPRNAASRANNAAWLALEAGHAAALAYAERAHALAPSEPAVQDTLGWILTRAGRAADGVPYLESATQSSPQVFEIRYHLAEAYVQTGNIDRAREILQVLLAGVGPFESREAARRLLESL